MTDQDSTSSSEQESNSSEAKHFKIIIAMGFLGSQDDAERFTALWIADAEARAHRINAKLFKNRIQLLPIPEGESEV